jgi:hypothetical protein
MEKSWPVKRQHWCHWIGLDFLIQKTPIVTPQKMNRSARTCIQSYPLLTRVGTWQFLKHDAEPRVFTFLWNRYHQWLADIELIQISTYFFWLLIPKWTCVSLLESKAGVGTWHSTRGHAKSTIVASIVYGFFMVEAKIFLPNVRQFSWLYWCVIRFFNGLFAGQQSGDPKLRRRLHLPRVLPPKSDTHRTITGVVHGRQVVVHGHITDSSVHQPE